ncbi:fucolectin-like [Hydractinia symbiolongicarpus]|uniref:fucolectin-like n=1 Tax=Hydractinia symbiolongicarpus TaxID=13093 RepID=UPI00254FFA53|nr:fucolectin-like [Hydractinia symbiolongicarpus]
MNVKILLFFFVAIVFFKRHTCKYFSKSREDVETEIVMEISSCTSLLTCAQKCHFKDLDFVYKDGRCYCVVVGKKRNEDNVTEVFAAVKDPQCPHGYYGNRCQIALINLSRGKPAQQSTTHAHSVNPVASLAVDGNTNGNFIKGTCFHTLSETAPWWQVDLLHNAVITNIKLHPRTDCCYENTKNLELLVKLAGQEKWNFCGYITKMDPIPLDKKCERPVFGRVVRIVQNNPKPFYLCEVEVYGYL